MIRITSCLLVAIMLQLIAAQNTGTYGTRPLLNDLCECINPWEGQTFNQHIGEPKNTCPNFCYVSCNSNCSDKKPAKGKGRCFSVTACNQDIIKTPTQPQGLCSCINPWEGQKFSQHIGEPKNTCPNFCYVSCNSNCIDKKPAKGKGRCYSELACNTPGTINPQVLCSCINPWEGQKFNQHIGDPQNTCPTFCYVGCTSVCNNKKAIKGAGKCYSEAACNQYIIKTPIQPTVPEVNISLLARIDLSQDDVPY